MLSKRIALLIVAGTFSLLAAAPSNALPVADHPVTGHAVVRHPITGRYIKDRSVTRHPVTGQLIKRHRSGGRPSMIMRSNRAPRR